MAHHHHHHHHQHRHHHNNNNSTPPSYQNPYPAWPPAPPAPPLPPPQSAHMPAPYATPQSTTAIMQNIALPPELQNLNLTPQQLALLFSHFQTQTGSPLPPPPPPPQFTAVPPPPPPPPTYPAVQYPSAFPRSSAVQGTRVAADQAQDQGSISVLASRHEHSHNDKPSHSNVPDSPQHDREDGELSDADQETNSRQPPQTRKRKLNASHADERLVSQRSSEYDAAQTNGHGHPRPIPPFRGSQVIGQQQQIKEDVFGFVAALHQNGISLNELVREGLDEALLRSMYEEMHLSVTPPRMDHSTLAVKTSNAPAAQQDPINGATTPQQPPKPTAKAESTKSSASTTLKPAATAPVDRQSYLARLQAAKNKKTSAPSPKAPVPSVAPTAPSAAITAAPTAPAAFSKSSAPSGPAALRSSAPVVPTQSSTQSQPSQKSLPHHVAPAKEQSASKISDAATELVRKKMEALKSMKRRMAPQQPAVAPAAPPTQPNADQSAASTDFSTPTTTKTSQPESVSLPTLAQDRNELPTFQAPVAPQVSSTAGNIPGIPGLFMSTAAPTSSPGSTQSNTPSAAVVSLAQPAPYQPTPKEDSATLTRIAPHSRKRPVAADLNETHTPTEAPLYKRPFGRSRQNSSDDAMIIEVSDDEGNADDDDSADPGTASSAMLSSTLRQKNIRDLPPLRDFPQRSTANKAGMFQGNTTPLGTPGTSSDIEELRRKEREINALQVKIQEFERRKKSLKAKAQLDQSQPGTPNIAQVAPSDAPDAMAPGETPILPTVSTVPGLGYVKAEPNSVRHSKLTEDISASDAVLNQRRTQMMQLQQQMADLQKQYDQEERKKLDLRGELERIDINTEGMSHSEMQARKDEIDKQTQQAKANDVDESMPLDSEGPSQSSAEGTILSKLDGNLGIQNTLESSSEEGAISETDTPADEGNTGLGPSNLSNGDSQATTMDGNISSSKAEDIAITATVYPNSTESEDQGSSMSESSESDETQPEIVRLFVGNLPFSMTKEELFAMFSSFNVRSVDLCLKGRKPAGFAFVSLPSAQAVKAIDRLNNTLVKDRRLAVQMARPVQTVAATLPEDHGLPAADASSSDVEMNMSETSSDESDDEPQSEEAAPEIAAVPTTPQPEGNNTSAEDESGESEMDLDSSDSSDSEDDEDYEPAPAEVTEVAQTDSAQVQPIVDVDASLTDSSVPDVQVDAQQQTEVEASHSASLPQYVPYQSPLKMFKKYRFHPDYLENVSGGFHSLTYSHRIKDDIPLCRFEIAGGICRDQSCDGQHWRDMALSDDQLLIQLGTGKANPAKTKEDIARYNVGLKSVIQQLRQQDETSDTESIGTRIAEHRRRFIGDPTVVVTQ